MRNKRLIIVIIILIILGGIFWKVIQKTGYAEQAVEEITPEEEISEEQTRKTIVTLFFKVKETGELEEEARSVDVKLLANNPYEELVKMLIDGPKDENLQKAIPEGTKINNIRVEGNVAYVDLSSEFINNHEGGLENENITIYSIVNTLTELNEINFVKILIDGQENLEFADGCMNFKNNFEKND